MKSLLNCSMLILLLSFLLPVAHARAQEVTGIEGNACNPLIAGQNLTVGQVCVSVDGANLVVEYETSGNWYLSETQAWTGDTLATMPQTKTGSPKIGNFPWKATTIDLQDNSFSIPLSSINARCGVDFLLAAHAVVYRVEGLSVAQAETAWSAGTRFVTKGTWGTYSGFRFDCSPIVDVQPATSTETAFAYGNSAATCFLDLGFSRWGWTNGPIAEGNYTWPIYAGAGQCDRNKGYYVGNLGVSYSNGSLSVTFTAFESYDFDATHVYAGANDLPVVKQGQNLVETVAPGQYTVIDTLADGTTRHTVTITGLSGPVHVVAHAVVEGIFGGLPE